MEAYVSDKVVREAMFFGSDLEPLHRLLGAQRSRRSGFGLHAPREKIDPEALQSGGRDPVPVRRRAALRDGLKKSCNSPPAMQVLAN
eukprot:s3758_g10.t1